jgi:outer membrane protein, multidrug efflux system
LIVAAGIVREYVELRGLQARLEVARQNVDIQSQTLRLTQDRLAGGRGNEFDVARSRSLLNLTRSGIPYLEAAAAQTIHRLAVLVGETPGKLLPELSVPQPMPSGLTMPGLSDPESLLRRRPDIRAAERRLAASTARIGVATADLFPRVVVLGGAGVQAETISNFDRSGSETWSVGPRISWAAFDLGRVRARIRASDARAEAALAAYEGTVLLSLEETENALVSHSRETTRLHWLQESVGASRSAVDLVHQRYDAGSVDFLSVLDAERTLLEVQDQSVASRTRATASLVAIYKALGAGFPEARP